MSFCCSTELAFEKACEELSMLVPSRTPGEWENRLRKLAEDEIARDSAIPPDNTP